jgi:hypothetical protein
MCWILFFVDCWRVFRLNPKTLIWDALTNFCVISKGFKITLVWKQIFFGKSLSMLAFELPHSGPHCKKPLDEFLQPLVSLNQTKVRQKQKTHIYHSLALHVN